MIEAMRDKICVMRTIDGADVVAFTTYNEGDDFVTLETPAMIMPQQDGQGNISVGMLPYCLGLVKGTPVPVSLDKFIIAPTKSEDKMSDMYRRRFGSGFEVENLGGGPPRDFKIVR